MAEARGHHCPGEAVARRCKGAALGRKEALRQSRGAVSAAETAMTSGGSAARVLDVGRGARRALWAHWADGK